ncbi:MAG: ParA family protein [Mucilaginibacter sp.]|jgi:chromosome partitioning protein|uniref:ParA family protein n=1 Tax=Mucilaginibacter sp. TaxID=1882438 RepID=UPI003569ED8A
MAKIITLAHQKGGVGKSTLALNLALCFKDQLRVALIDSDLQGSIYHLKEDFPELDILAPEKISEIPNLDYDLIIVDIPPYLSNRLNELFGYSDYVLVLTKAGFFDAMAIKSTLALIKFAQAQNYNLKAGIMLNMLKPRSGITLPILGIKLRKGLSIFHLQPILVGKNRFNIEKGQVAV